MIENISRVSAENMLRQNKDEKICDFTSTGNSCSEAYKLPKNFCVKNTIIPIDFVARARAPTARVWVRPAPLPPVPSRATAQRHAT
jgi:hypothetical protein